jgi:hypothetical protein
MLEQLYSTNPKGRCAITIKEKQFTVAFENMRQVNSTGGSRQVRRETAADVARHAECSICCCDEIPADPPTAMCTHPTNIICAQCLQKHISEELNNKGSVTDIKCPVVGCRKFLSYNDVKRGATVKDFARYDTLLTTRLLSTLPEFRWCKVLNCGNGQIHDGDKEAPIMTCHKCKGKSCFTHDVPWHTGITCEEYDKQIGQETKANTDYLLRETKPCPQCNRAIQKNDGCDHMTCRLPGGCGHEFCWKCMASYGPILRKGNHHHNPTCIYFAAYDSDDENDDDDDE